MTSPLIPSAQATTSRRGSFQEEARRTTSSNPQRSCIGCRRVADPSALVRVTRTRQGELALGRHLPGRGAWLCRGSMACAEQAARRGAFSRALRAELAPGSVSRLIDQLRAGTAPEQPVRANGATGVREDRGQMPTGRSRRED
ncbi:MAG: YlxR family protein [Acidimicrobiales bacterium]|nr:YlxR family protein [Acidimicrobiales bacterium]MBO0894477.1 YlxR family protein [Acidimicrobiales bacterium]